jgi:hypothetical protein
VDIDENLSHLDADLEIKCWSSTHSAYAFGVAIPVLIFWVISDIIHQKGLGIPILAFLKLRFNREKIFNKDRDFSQKYGFLFHDYKIQFYYWLDVGINSSFLREVVVLFRKFIYISLIVFLSQLGPVCQVILKN